MSVSDQDAIRAFKDVSVYIVDSISKEIAEIRKNVGDTSHTSIGQLMLDRANEMESSLIVLIEYFGDLYGP